MFAIVPLISFLFNNYGVSGGLLLISGVILQGLPLALLLGNPKYKTEATPPPTTVSQENSAYESTISTIPTELNTCVTDPMNYNKASGKELAFDIITINKNVEQVKIISGTDYNKVNYVATEDSQCQEQFTECKQTPITNILLETPLHKTEQRSDSVNILEQNPLTKDSEMNKKESKYRKALRTFQLFKNPIYLVIMLCQSLHGYVVLLVFTVVIDISRDKGIDHSLEHFFLMSLLISEAFGYTCLGWVTDKGFLSVTNFMAILFSCMGLSCCGLVFSNEFFTMICACFGFGLFSTAISAVNPALVYEFVEDEKHTMAIASRVMLFPPLSSTVAPVIGKSI